MQASGGNAVYAALVFMRLLVGDTDQVRHLLLRKAEHDAPFPNAGADMPIRVVRAVGRLRGFCFVYCWHDSWLIALLCPALAGWHSPISKNVKSDYSDFERQATDYF
jgi:hypothetical protein